MNFQSFVLVVTLLVLSIHDFRTRRLPDALTLPLIALGLFQTWLNDAGAVGIHLAAAVAGFGSFFSLSLIYRRIRNENGLGLGDAKLMAAAGAWLGPLYLAPVVFVGATFALGYVIARRTSGVEFSATSIVPFGPFLCAAFFIFWCISGFGEGRI